VEGPEGEKILPPWSGSEDRCENELNIRARTSNAISPGMDWEIGMIGLTHIGEKPSGAKVEAAAGQYIAVVP